jgi:hypothetical protein
VNSLKKVPHFPKGAFCVMLAQKSPLKLIQVICKIARTVTVLGLNGFKLIKLHSFRIKVSNKPELRLVDRPRTACPWHGVAIAWILHNLDVLSTLPTASCKYVVNNSMELNPSWKAASKDFPNILWDLKVQYSVHKSPPLLSFSPEPFQSST